MFDEKPVENEGAPSKKPFDFNAFPPNSLFHDRREGRERRDGDADAKGVDEVPREVARPKPERRAKKERRRRIDPTTFEKQYTNDELEFMNAMQRFKVQTCKAFPSHGDVLQVAFSLGYRKSVWENDSIEADAFESEATSND